ncbi:hypothetical protein DSM110277_03754 (plasmid) [Sulfitobacter pontiacus]|uniref:PemK-like, MazF-like toxin of type II toxin-antitoxin system n=1 Tax=Sulfitobacter pontiacus TaxID=60137 RepID=A0AAX3AHP0_9RHOB|nr:hypothetical protein DSM110277_03754 [Sulfitobacter pontiacus]
MTDCNQTAPTAWQSDLKPNHIVAFRFPHEHKSSVSPKVRPTLVLDVLTIGEERHAVLAYGTSSFRRRSHDLLVPVNCSVELEAASLFAPTKFDGARRILVPLSDAGFSCSCKLSTPILGHLTGRSADRVDIVRRCIRQGTRPRRSTLYRNGRKSETETHQFHTLTQAREAYHV